MVFKTIVGCNPLKKEVSIEETEVRYHAQITRKWQCKYFVKSRHHFRSQKVLETWLSVHQGSDKKVKDCHILRHVDTFTGKTDLLCKVRGEFFVVKDLTALKIVYVNSLKIHLEDEMTKGD